MIHSQKRLFKKEYALELLRIAQGDAQSALALFSVKNSGRRENIDPYAALRRYEEGQLPLTPEEIQAALDMMQKIIQWASDIVSSK